MIEKGERSEVLMTHLAIVVRTAEDDRDMGVEILDQLGHGETCHVLIECRGKADQLVLAPINRP